MSEAGDFSDNLDSNSGDSEYILEHEEEDDESSEEEGNIFSQSSTYSTVSRASASDEKKRKREALEIFFPLSYMYSTIKINSTLFFPLNFERDCCWSFS